MLLIFVPDMFGIFVICDITVVLALSLLSLQNYDLGLNMILSVAFV